MTESLVPFRHNECSETDSTILLYAGLPMASPMSERFGNRVGSTPPVVQTFDRMLNKLSFYIFFTTGGE